MMRLWSCARPRSLNTGLLLVLLVCAHVPLSSAEAAPAGLGATTAATRTAAEAELAAARTRIANEHAAALRELQVALAAANSARERLTTVEQDAALANTTLSKRRTEHERDLAHLRQLADRVVIAAHLPSEASRALTTKPVPERLDAAAAGLAQRLSALPKRLGRQVQDEAVISRDGRQVTVPVLRLGEARAVALGPDDASRGVLERSIDGASWLVIGPRLPAEVSAPPLAANVIALDAAGSAAHQAGEVHRTFSEWLAAGRFFIWPIIAVFILGVLIAGERMLTLLRISVDPRRLVEVASLLARNDHSAAQALVAPAASPLDRVLAAGLGALQRPREAREAAVEQALIHETGHLTRGLPAMAVLAGVAPLLGLLGTVTGMIDMFAVIAAQGSGNAKSLSGGISEALVCTQAGMLAAIPLLLLHAWLARLADRRAQVLEEAACGVLGLAEHGDAPNDRARSEGASA